MLDAFKMGGFGMIPTTMFGLLLVAAAVRYAVSPEKRFVPLQLSLGIMTLSSGGLGFVTGCIRSFMAMDGAPADKKWIWLFGVGESAHNLAFAFGLVTVACLAASIGALRIATKALPASA